MLYKVIQLLIITIMTEDIYNEYIIAHNIGLWI